MKIIKTAFSLLSALICHIQGYAQTDSAYARINVYDPSNFKEIYLPQHKFSNPTIDFDRMVDDFIPEAKTTLKNQYENHTLNGKIKKITKFKKYPKEDQKQIIETHFFNQEGFLVKINSMVTMYTYLHYDSQNRLIRKETVRDSDTLKIKKYSYNNKNQITGYMESYMEQGKLKYGHWEVIYDPDNHSILVNAVQPDRKPLLIKKYIYDGNKVKLENYMDGVLLQNTGHEFVYSENNNLISRKSREYSSFFSYDKHHRNTKEVNIMIGKTWDVHTKKYDKNGYITHFSYENPVSKDSGSTKFKYDKFNNKIYEASGPDVKINPYEYFYEIEYY